MIKALATAAALGLVLTACDGGAPATQASTDPPRPRVNQYQQKLLALNDRDRKLALRRAIQDDAGGCPRIQTVRYQQEYQRMAMWVARCQGRFGPRNWAIYVGASGQVQVRDCATAAKLGLPECRPQEG